MKPIKEEFYNQLNEFIKQNKTTLRCAKFATLSNKIKQMNFGNIVIIMSELAQSQETLRSGDL